MMPPVEATPSSKEPAGSLPSRKLHCRIVAEGASRPRTHLGDLPPVDLHGALGMADPAGSASISTVLLATLGGCLVERIRANAAVGGITIRHLELSVEADMAASPIWQSAGREPGPVGFESVQVKVHLDADAPEDALHALVKHAILWSPVANTLHAPIHLDVAFVPKVVS